MRIVTPEILSYFASLHFRIAEATHVPFRAVSFGDWHPKPAECHKNVDHWIAGYKNRTRIRGWLTWGWRGPRGVALPRAEEREDEFQKYVIATAVSKYVFKLGRFTVHPS